MALPVAHVLVLLFQGTVTERVGTMTGRHLEGFTLGVIESPFFFSKHRAGISRWTVSRHLV